MTITTQDCKKFIVTFLQSNPQIIARIFGDEYPDELQETQDHLTNIKNWSRTSKRIPDEDDLSPADESCLGYYKDGVQPNHYGETTGLIPETDVQWVRSFSCKGTDFGFLVLETKTGDLLLGEARD